MSLRTIGILAIILSAIVATVLSMSVNMDGYELGAMFNLVIPPFVGVVAILVYLITYWLSKSEQLRITVLVLCCIYLLYVGIAFRTNGEYLPFPFE